MLRKTPSGLTISLQTFRVARIIKHRLPKGLQDIYGQLLRRRPTRRRQMATTDGVLHNMWTQDENLEYLLEYRTDINRFYVRWKLKILALYWMLELINFCTLNAWNLKYSKKLWRLWNTFPNVAKETSVVTIMATTDGVLRNMWTQDENLEYLLKYKTDLNRFYVKWKLRIL